MVSDGCCVYDGLPCERFSDDLGYGACYVKRLDGSLKSVCPRFVVKAGVSISEDLVPEGVFA